MKDEQKARELWLNYPAKVADEAQQEKFWKKYEKLKQGALRIKNKQEGNHLTQVNAASNFVTSIFSSEKQLKPKFRRKLLRSKVKSMASILGALTAFTYVSLFSFSVNPMFGHILLGGCTILFSGTLIINYVGDRPLANTLVELQPYALLRKGKGLKTITIRYDDIVEVEEDDFGLYIKTKATKRSSHYQYANQETLMIPSIMQNYEQLKQQLVAKWKKK